MSRCCYASRENCFEKFVFNKTIAGRRRTLLLRERECGGGGKDEKGGNSQKAKNRIKKITNVFYFDVFLWFRLPLDYGRARRKVPGVGQSPFPVRAKPHDVALVDAISAPSAGRSVWLTVENHHLFDIIDAAVC